jgi:hypothetical protein
MAHPSCPPAATLACFECGAPAVFNHHVIPRNLGGRQTVPLCAACHGKVHGITFTPHHQTLIKQGMARARAAGKRLGRPCVIRPTTLLQIREALAGGMSKNKVCRVFGVKRTTLYDSLARAAHRPPRVYVRRPGRPRTISDETVEAICLVLAQGWPKVKICRVFRISRPALYAALASAPRRAA